jgi:hypothetical protein
MVSTTMGLQACVCMAFHGFVVELVVVGVESGGGSGERVVVNNRSLMAATHLSCTA